MSWRQLHLLELDVRSVAACMLTCTVLQMIFYYIIRQFTFISTLWLLHLHEHVIWQDGEEGLP